LGKGGWRLGGSVLFKKKVREEVGRENIRMEGVVRDWNLEEGTSCQNLEEKRKEKEKKVYRHNPVSGQGGKVERRLGC